MTLPANSALLLIDVQQGLDDPYWGVRNNPGAEQKMARLLAAYREAGLPVIHVQHMSTRATSPLRPGLPGNAIKPEVAPLPGEPLFQKSVNSAFIGTALEAELREQRVGCVVIAGLTTDHCVSSSARMAANLGFDTIVVADATATFDVTGPEGDFHTADEVHRVALASLHGEFATVRWTDDLLGTAGRARPIAEYRFAGDAADSSGSMHHGVVHGATLVEDRFGRAAHAYQFDGIDDYVEISPPPALEADGFSISAWVRFDPRDMSGWTNCIVAQDDGNDEDQSRRVFQLSAYWGRIVWHRMIGARDPTCRTPVQPGAWQHVVGVHDHGDNRLYVNGALQDSVRHRAWVHATQPLHIGREGTDEPHFFFRGAIDDVLVYDRAITVDEIRALFHEGGWMESTT